jgi:hypothetical protein
LRAGDLEQSTITAKGFDSDNAFMLVEFAGSEMNFQTISRMGQSVDSGVIQQQARSSVNSSPPAWSVAVGAIARMAATAPLYPTTLNPLPFVRQFGHECVNLIPLP